MDKNVDKGFELNYWNLSYRRKFIRSLWVTAFFVIIVVLIFLFKINISFLIPIKYILFIGTVVCICQLIYTFNKWKSNE